MQSLQNGELLLARLPGQGLEEPQDVLCTNIQPLTTQNQVSGLDPVAKAKEEEEKRVKEVEATMSMSIPQPRKRTESNEA